MTAGIIRRGARANRASRRRNAATRRATPIQVTAASASSTVLTVTFDQPVVLDGVPKFLTDVIGALPVGAQLVDPMTLEITFSNSVAAATEVRIPYEEPAIRNASGGFVSTSTFPVGN